MGRITGEEFEVSDDRFEVGGGLGGILGVDSVLPELLMSGTKIADVIVRCNVQSTSSCCVLMTIRVVKV